MSLTVLLTGPAKRDLKRLDRELTARIIHGIEQFALTSQGDVRRLTGPLSGFFRLRIGKDWRVVVRIGHRSQVYRVKEEAVFQYGTEAVEA